MNANAYGGELGRVLEWVEIATAAGLRAPRSRASWGWPTAAPNLASGEVVARASLAARARRPEAEIKATLAEMRTRRHEAQPQGIKTFGSTFKNPDDARAAGAARGSLLAAGRVQRAGGRRRSLRAQARELHREHRLGDDGRRVGGDGGGTAPGAGAIGVELEPEVQTLGDVRFPWR